MKKFTARDISETIELENGLTAKIRFDDDQDHGAPWKENEGHGPVSEWTTRDKLPGERVLSTDRRAKRFYDFAGAVKIAKRDGWGVANPPAGATKGQIAALAVESDFEFLREWCADLWRYVVVFVTIENEEGREIAADCLGGVEARGNYEKEQAADMLNALLETLEETAKNEPACHI